MEWHQRSASTPARLRWHQHGPDELAHYARAAFDIQYEFPFGWQEIEGIHNRGDFDLGRHQEFSGKKLEYFDQAANERYLPFVVETSAGADRVTLTAAGRRLPRGGGRGRDPRRARLPSGARADQGRRVPAGQEGRHAGDRRPRCTTTSSARFPAFYDDSGAIGRRYRRLDEAGTPFCITVDGDTLADRTVTVRHRDTMQQERVGHGPGGRLRRGEDRTGTTEACASPTSKPWSAGWPTRFPASFSRGSPRSSSRPARCRIRRGPDIFTHGRVHPAPGAAGGGPEAVQSRVVLYHGSFAALARVNAGTRLAGGGVGDADPRAAPPPRVARAGARPGGVRLGGRAELRPAGRGDLRSGVLPVGVPRWATMPGAWRTTSFSTGSWPRCPTPSRSAGAGGSTWCRSRRGVASGVPDPRGRHRSARGRAGAGGAPEARHARPPSAGQAVSCRGAGRRAHGLSSRHRWRGLSLSHERDGPWSTR